MHPLSWSVKGFYKPICGGAEPSPHTHFTFRFPQYRIWYAPFEALVDTGSPFTAISTRDAERHQISFRTLNREQKPKFIGFGGISFIPRIAKNAELIFKDEEGKKHQVAHDPLYILEPNLPHNKWQEAGVYRYPNIIGMDFVKKQKVRLNVDPELNSFAMEFRE